MSKNINLVLKEETEVLKRKRRIKVFRLVSAALLLLVLLMALSIYLLNLRVAPSTIDKDKDALLNQLLPLREKEGKLKVVNDRINNISSVLNVRRDVYKIVNTLLEEVPGGIKLDNLEFSEQLVAIKVSSDSLLLVDELINNLIDMARRKEIVSTLILNSLDATAAGEYSVSINIGLI